MIYKFSKMYLIVSNKNDNEIENLDNLGFTK